jgi:protein-tyrosine phosphatase
MSTTNHEPSVLSYPHKTDNYTFRVPTPPRIVVPPPTLNVDALPQISIHALNSRNYEFLQSVDYDNLVRQNAQLEWTYERRREAQLILPFLCLGPMTAAKDETWLRKEGVTMLLGVRQKHMTFESRLMSSALRTAEKLGLEHHTIDLADNQDLIRSFTTTCHVINDHLARTYQATNGQKLGKVLVFCESGNDRSAGVVAAYLMETHEDVDYIKAMQLCQAQRFCVNFDDAMKRLLQGYWDILVAQRSVSQQSEDSIATHGTAAASAPPRCKRGLEREVTEDASMDMDMDEDDMERFGGRVFAPFVDQPL